MEVRGAAFCKKNLLILSEADSLEKSLLLWEVQGSCGSHTDESCEPLAHLKPKQQKVPLEPLGVCVPVGLGPYNPINQWKTNILREASESGEFLKC